MTFDLVTKQFKLLFFCVAMMLGVLSAWLAGIFAVMAVNVVLWALTPDWGSQPRLMVLSLSESGWSIAYFVYWKYRVSDGTVQHLLAKLERVGLFYCSALLSLELVFSICVHRMCRADWIGMLVDTLFRWLR